LTVIDEKVHRLLSAKDLPLCLRRMITLAGQEASTDYSAEAGAELGLADRGAGLKLPAIGGDGEAPNSLGGETGAGAPETSGAMLNSAADAWTLTAAAETGLKMRIMGQDLGHEAPPSASETWRGLPAIYFPLYPLKKRNHDQAGNTRKQGRRR
jgi:hypothetical protein